MAGERVAPVSLALLRGQRVEPVHAVPAVLGHPRRLDRLQHALPILHRHGEPHRDVGRRVWDRPRAPHISIMLSSFLISRGL
jgi:hypothetical protein